MRCVVLNHRPYAATLESPPCRLLVARLPPADRALAAGRLAIVFHMRFGVLGPLAVWTDTGEPVPVPGAKVRALLAHLLIHRGESVSADRLLEDLWDGAPPADASGALQSTVSRLRRVLDRAEPGSRAMVESGPSGYRLRADPKAVDSGRFEALLADARAAGDPETAAGLLAEALGLWRGPALADHADASFAAPAIARWEEQRTGAVEDHMEARLDQGEDASLIGELDELVGRYPLRERLRAVHMRALYRAGRQAEALADYRRFRALLAEEIGVDPGPELSRLHQDMLAQSPGLAAAAPNERGRLPEPETGRAPEPPPSNLPALLSEVVGRETATIEVRKLLDSGRLVTLTGPGGVGKTTLALEAADQGRFPHGTWLVELSGRDNTSTGRDTLVQCIAADIGLRDDDGPRGPLLDLLIRMLRGKRALLILDNCEHVLVPVAGVVGELLRRAPELRVLITSREALGLPGELLYQVSPLDLPIDPTPEELARSSAARLFVQRASAVAPDFTVDTGNAAAIADLCRRLDGLPLALELAAARMRALDVRELAERLNDRFRVLASGSAGVPARQQTLRAVIDWSWELLTPAEQAVLRRVSVHANGFTLAAAEVVGSGDGVAPGDVPDVLVRLVDRSLVLAEQLPFGTRYRLLETVAAYALERLADSGEAEAARWRHARYYTDYAEESRTRLRGRRQREYLVRLDIETANLHTTLGWAVSQDDAELALRLTGALGWYWFLRGRYHEARRSLAQALATEGPHSTAARARALTWYAALGFVERHESSEPADAAQEALALYADLDDPAGLAEAQALLGFLMATHKASGAQLPSAAELIEAAHTTFRRLDDPWWLAATLHFRGWEALHRSELADARKDAEESHSLFCGLGDPWGQVRSSNLLGVLAGIEGRYEEAARLHRTGLGHAEEIGLWPTAAEDLTRLGRLAMLVRDFAAADDYNERALRIATEQSFTGVLTYARGGLGMSARRQWRLAAAEEHLSAVLAVHRTENYRPGLASLLAELGFTAEMRKDTCLARTLHLEGLEHALASEDPRAVAQALEGIAGADALDGDAPRAARLLGAAAAAREASGAPLPEAERFDVDRIEDTVRASLGGDVFAAEFQRGTSMSLDAAGKIATAPRTP